MSVVSLDSARQKKWFPPTAEESGFFTTEDGVRIYFEDTGGEGRPLYYIYGLGCSIQHWKYPLAYFSRKRRRKGKPARPPRRQIWTDFRGHGRSEAPPDDIQLTIAQIADDIAAFCKDRGVAEAVFLGQSMGGLIALELAHRHPGLARGLVLLATPAGDPTDHLPLAPYTQRVWDAMTALNRLSPTVMRRLAQLASPLGRVPGVIAAVREVVRHTGFNPHLARAEDVEEYLQQVFNMDPKLFYDLADDLRNYDVGTYAREVETPALVIAGRQDRIVPPAESRRLAKLLPNSTLRFVRHGSHCPHFDDPTRVGRLIDQFLDEHHL